MPCSIKLFAETVSRKAGTITHPVTGKVHQPAIEPQVVVSFLTLGCCMRLWWAVLIIDTILNRLIFIHRLGTGSQQNILSSLYSFVVAYGWKFQSHFNAKYNSKATIATMKNVILCFMWWHMGQTNLTGDVTAKSLKKSRLQQTILSFKVSCEKSHHDVTWQITEGTAPEMQCCTDVGKSEFHLSSKLLETMSTDDHHLSQLSTFLLLFWMKLFEFKIKNTAGLISISGYVIS